MTKNDVPVQQSQRLHENIGEHIGFELGAKMVKDYYDSFGENKAHFVGRTIIEKILAQPDCIGINMYKALNAKGEQTYVFVGVDRFGKAILEYTAVNDNGTLSKEIGMIANKFSPQKPGDGWFEWSF
ncbi:hypothetical protein [Agriterribacter sp.]|uniref:hypothetical protein n=1 Tax=Agriterribacter sp. TaxID=2821509 RepID=UPI002CD75FA9|nr:hypothetical protein [Agriterribacter sp.]HTN07889.1 hypothetical protein [Agriterribacter sp.]